jgi:hypothetical protein
MASQTRPRASEDERRQKIRTVGIATVASATAAVVVSQFWIAGTWMAAALTPVLVTLISELLHKPTAAITNRLTTERDSILPEAGGAGPPPRRRDDVLPDRAPAEPGSTEPARTQAGPVRVYRSGAPGGRGRPVRRKIAIGAIAATAAIAFAVTAVAITGTELITGGSIGKGSHRTTFLGGSKPDKPSTEDRQTTTPSEQDTDKEDQQRNPQTTPSNDDQQQPTTPRQQQPPQQTTPTPTVPTTPPTTTTP